MFAINPYSAKNQKIVKEPLDYGKIAVYNLPEYFNNESDEIISF
jgi:hypothetical protein